MYFFPIENVELRDILVVSIFILAHKHAIMAFGSILSAPKAICIFSRIFKPIKIFGRLKNQHNMRKFLMKKLSKSTVKLHDSLQFNVVA